jgi:hypothetical protein
MALSAPNRERFARSSDQSPTIDRLPRFAEIGSGFSAFLLLDF